MIELSASYRNHQAMSTNSTVLRKLGLSFGVLTGINNSYIDIKKFARKIPKSQKAYFSKYLL